ncbi:MAG: ergothioneine biosynthesis protein EgtB [Janthinobacterium lividum]
MAAYWAVRRFSDQLCAALTPEDQVIQSMPDASPAKWHRAHTSWFFEQFVLVPHMADYQPFSREFSYLFNSYYETVGARHPRFARGLITRPGVAEVDAYRAYVDDAMARLLATNAGLGDLVTLGLHHEQQHQELLVTDMLHGFAENPLLPAMIPGWQATAPSSMPDEMIAFDRQLVQVGHAGPGFAFDNEGPPHEALVLPFKLGRRLVRNAAWLEFMADGGYRTPTLWMSDGWSAAVDGGWQAPLHWRQQDGIWFQFGPGGEAVLVPDEPVRHVSWYEADAFARWAGARLPTEFEWESACRDPRLAELDGHVWQWTNSAYLPYPGFRPVEGAIGEYNGKFMINTMVLRGSSMATPPGHARLTYRNFFHPEKRWQFTGLRLAADPS